MCQSRILKTFLWLTPGAWDNLIKDCLLKTIYYIFAEKDLVYCILWLSSLDLIYDNYGNLFLIFIKMAQTIQHLMVASDGWCEEETKKNYAIISNICYSFKLMWLSWLSHNSPTIALILCFWMGFNTQTNISIFIYPQHLSIYYYLRLHRFLRVTFKKMIFVIHTWKYKYRWDNISVCKNNPQSNHFASFLWHDLTNLFLWFRDQNFRNIKNSRNSKLVKGKYSVGSKIMSLYRFGQIIIELYNWSLIKSECSLYLRIHSKPAFWFSFYFAGYFKCFWVFVDKLYCRQYCRWPKMQLTAINNVLI